MKFQTVKSFLPMPEGQKVITMFSENSPADALSAGVRNAASERFEELKTCIHEVGHAFSAIKLRIPVDWVSIDPFFIKQRVSDWKGSFGIGACAISAERIAPVLERGRLLSKEDKKDVVEYGITLMAGPFAEEMYQPSSYNIQTSEEDFEQLSHALCMLEPRTFERNRIWRVIFKSTTSLVEEIGRRYARLQNC
ncbi:hypothetical protein NLY44_26665 [Mesorhizobium sp. C089B]|uniref:hypothetical protein n=1 Tax=Mesorhizobium sp. C089B TaxID=2956823 RepID=UPI0025782973|nr:hypothetical protein [Mesorhizobium sp. C089B]WJI50140.1 hypothetical protein NLY44_26665 [Mesorhizobium sp. C089B]